MDIILIKILLAHLIGDFFLQPTSWVKDKEDNKLLSSKLYLHICIHVALIFIIFLSFSVWKLALFIGIIHLAIDVCKLIFQTKKNARGLFFIDQGLHLISLLFIWSILYNKFLNFEFLDYPSFWILVSSALFLSLPSSIVIKVIVNKWIPITQEDKKQSLQNAGKYIGVLERLLIFIFIISNHFEAVGFLIAAKSIFRFGDLTKEHDLKLTEYVLIGTLLSFGIAIVVAMTVNQLIL